MRSPRQLQRALAEILHRSGDDWELADFARQADKYRRSDVPLVHGAGEELLAEQH